MIPANPSSLCSLVETNGSLSVAPAAAASQATDSSTNQATDGSIRMAPAKYLGQFKDAEYYAQCNPYSIIYYASEEVKKVSLSVALWSRNRLDIPYFIYTDNYWPFMTKSC